MRLTRLVVTGVLMAAGLGVALGQTPSVTFLGMDTTTLGSWKGVYGQDGQYLPDFQFSVPPYSGLNPIEDNQRLELLCDPLRPAAAFEDPVFV